MDIHSGMKLKILQAGSLVLHQEARELSKEEILSPFIQQLIEMMKETVRDAPGVGLAAPQVGLPFKMAIIEDRAEYHEAWTSEQLEERGRKPVAFHAIFNPKIFFDTNEKVEFFEACLSFNGITGLTPRATAVRVECLNEKAEPIVISAKGWYARILQHEIDHMQGILFVGRADSRTLMTMENFNRFWRNKPLAEVKQQFCPSCEEGVSQGVSILKKWFN